MPKVRFNLKDAGGLILLKFRYRRGGLPFVYSTRQYIDPKLWDKSIMRAKASIRNPQHADLNKYLQMLEDETQNVYRRLLMDGVQPNKGDIKKHLDAVTFVDVEEKVTLLSYFQTLLDDMAANPKTNKSNTVNSYQGAIKVLRRYAAAKRRELDFDSIDFAWLRDFERWCYSEDYATNTVWKFVKMVKTVVNRARKEGHTDNRIVTERGFGVSKVDSNKMVLTLDELEKIQSIDWGKVDTYGGMTRQRLQKVATVILAGCWSGLRHSDLAKISNMTIDGDSVNIWTKKTQVMVSIPLLPPLRKILEENNYSLPYASRSEVLTVGRQVLRLAGVDTSMQWKDTRGGGVTIKTIKKYEQFSSHVMRRTFATTMFLLGVDPNRIMTVTGHRTQEQLMAYINAGRWLSSEHERDLQKWRLRLGLAV